MTPSIALRSLAAAVVLALAGAGLHPAQAAHPSSAHGGRAVAQAGNRQHGRLSHPGGHVSGDSAAQSGQHDRRQRRRGRGRAAGVQTRVTAGRHSGEGERNGDNTLAPQATGTPKAEQEHSQATETPETETPEAEHAQAATGTTMSGAGEATSTEVPTAAEETATPQATGTPSVGEGQHGSDG